MKTILLLCLPLLVQAQLPPQADKPHNLRCSHANSSERWMHASLDAESLHTYDQRELELYVTVPEQNSPMLGIAVIRLVAREPLSEILLNAETLTISEVRVNGVLAAFTHALDTLRVFREVAQDENVHLMVTYSVLPVPNGNETGFHLGWEHCFTFAEPFGARRWYPCWDQPSDKFDRVETTVNMPEQWTLASNGRLVNSSSSEGRVTQRYLHEQPISTYLVSIAAGNFSNQTFEQNGVQYRYYAWPRSDSAQAAYDWQRTPEMVDHFSDLFGGYPFAEYGMAMTDIFGGWGAMEHQTFTTYGFNLVDSARTFEGIVAHELAHQWFGDHLSPVDFRNMWLNESFATYGDILWSEYVRGEDGLHAAMRTATNVCLSEERNNPPSYSIYDPPSDRLFGANVYYKGAWALHMLRTQLLGDSLFFAVLQDWVETYAGGNVNTQEFINIVNEHYDGPDVDWFFDQWVYGLGYPVISVSVITDIGEAVVVVNVEQRQATPGFFRLPLIIEQGTAPNIQLDTLWFEAAEFSVNMTAAASNTARLAAEQIVLFENVTSDLPEPPSGLPSTFAMAPAYPNPFNPSVTIPLSLSMRSTVDLTLFDVTGRTVATVFKGVLDAGAHSLNYQAPTTLAAGVYLVRASNGETTQTQKLLLLK